jgi:drug/metabolite transporter (DMT)-like permease
MLCAFIGVLLILRPDVSVQWGTLYAIGMTICSGCYAVATRALGKQEPPLVTLLFSGIMTAAVAGVATLAIATPVMPNAADLAVMAGIGLAGALSQLGLVVSHRMAEANRLAPFVYVQMPIALLAGFLLFGELPDNWGIVGIAVIVLAGLWVANARQPAFGDPGTRSPSTGRRSGTGAILMTAGVLMAYLAVLSIVSAIR